MIPLSLRGKAMPQFNDPEEYTWNAWKNAKFGSHAQKLWHGAKTNFYFRDNPSRAALLCNLIIDQFASSEEADEAKLLLHDIRLDIRNAIGVPQPDSAIPAVMRQPAEAPEQEALSATTKLSVATAVVALPVIGVAQDGVIGILVPEVAALAVMGSALWSISKIREAYLYFKTYRFSAE